MIGNGLLLALGLAWLAALPAWAQMADAPGAVGGMPAALPGLRLPSAEEIRAPLPRSVKAAAALAGLGRQRLALVLGLGTVGSRLVVEPAPRDARAVAAALRAGGFVVMWREDLGAADLRAALAEFHGRLQPGGVGFVYVSALGAQLNGVNLVLPRDTALPGAPAAGDVAAVLRRHGVPLTEVAAALVVEGGSGGPGGEGRPTTGPRLLVVDAAWRHPALAALPRAGLAEQPLPPGVMALFGHGLNQARDVPEATPLAQPLPADPAEIAASVFARVLVSALATPRISGPQALLDTRRALFDATQGQENLWLGGETDTEEELAEATLLEALVPRTPEEAAREALRQAGDRMMRPSAANGGERSVADVLSPPGAAQQQTGDAEGQTSGSAQAAQPTSPKQPSADGVGQAVTNAAGAAAELAGTVLGVAATAAAVAAVAQAAPTAAAAGVAGAAVETAGAAAGTGAAGTAAATAAREAADARPNRTRASPHDSRTVRHAEGGERPAYVPRRNAFGYAEGDTFSFQIVDPARNEVIGTTLIAIEQVLAEGQLVANGQQLLLDAQGRVKSRRHANGGFSEFEPAQDFWWSNPKPGEQREIRFSETFERGAEVRGRIEWQGTSRVAAPRRIETPAGAFEVLPIESSGSSLETLADGRRTQGRWIRTVYHSIRLGHPVAIDIQDLDRAGHLLRRERLELTHAQTSRDLP